jgi:hypothetical protein
MRQDSSFDEKQESHPAHLLVVLTEHSGRLAGDDRIHGTSSAPVDRHYPCAPLSCMECNKCGRPTPHSADHGGTPVIARAT